MASESPSQKQDRKRHARMTWLQWILGAKLPAGLVWYEKKKTVLPWYDKLLRTFGQTRFARRRERQWRRAETGAARAEAGEGGAGGGGAAVLAFFFLFLAVFLLRLLLTIFLFLSILLMFLVC